MYGAWRKRIPYVVTFHTGGNSSKLRHAARDTQWRTMTPLLRRATGLLPVSRFERARFSPLDRPSGGAVHPDSQWGTNALPPG